MDDVLTWSNRMKLQSTLGTVLVLTAVAACSRPAETDESLRRDLLEATAAVEMSRSGEVQVVSELEGGPAEQRTPRPSAAPAPRKPTLRAPATPARRPAPVVATAPQRVPAPATASTGSAEIIQDAPATVRPSSAPQGAGPAPPGGWKSIGEVMRNAPFPIKP